MDSTESRSLEWKICFKKILAPHLLNTTNMEEQNGASPPLNAYNGEEQNGVQDNALNPKNDKVNNITFLKNSDDVQKNYFINKKRISSITADAAQVNNRAQSFIDAFRHCRNSDLPDKEFTDTENAEEEEIAKIVAADAEELAKNFEKLKCKKKESTRNPPKWKHAFKKVLDPTYFFEPSESRVTTLTLEELNGDYNPLEDDNELSACSVSKNCDEEDSEMKSTENTSSSPKRPKNVPPPGGWVCVNTYTAQDLLKRPSIIPSEDYWDDDLIW